MNHAYRIKPIIHVSKIRYNKITQWWYSCSDKRRVTLNVQQHQFADFQFKPWDDNSSTHNLF